MLKNKIDGALFETEQEAFEHFKLNYLETHNTNDESMMEKLTEAFPDANIKITVGSDFGDYKIDLKFLNAAYSDYIGTDPGCVDSVNEFITTYKFINDSVQNILKKVSELYNFTDFKFSGYTDDYGNGCYINFDHEFGRNIYEGYNIDKFIDSLSQYFISVVEGEVEEVRDDGYFEDYSVGGVPLKGLLKRAKKVRMEILE